MKLSKHFKYIELNNKVYAIFNVVEMKIMFVNESMLKNILNMKRLDKGDIAELKAIKILVHFNLKDKLKYLILKIKINSTCLKCPLANVCNKLKYLEKELGTEFNTFDCQKKYEHLKLVLQKEYLKILQK